MLRRPSMQALSAPLARAARSAAERLAARGRRVWLVGGAVRDLALGRAVQDVDLASAAPPEEVEAAFERTFGAGKAFGTVLVLLDGLEVQHTTFRTDAGYGDARRPDAVAFGSSLEEDAQRRDFTCNALYLDPLTDELVDPTGGLADLERGRLACVGDAAARFAEDGLRLVRLARFAAGLGLDPDPATLAGARASAAALRGVSPERVLKEFETLFGRPRCARGLALLSECGLLTRALPGFGPEDEPWWPPRAALFEHLPARPELALGLAALYGPAAGDGAALAGFDEQQRAARLERLALLRPARETREAVGELWSRARELALDGPRAPGRARRLRWMRAPSWSDALALARAYAATGGGAAGAAQALDGLHAEASTLSRTDLWPVLLVRSEDLAALGLPRGPLWGRLLAEAEERQLDGAFADRAAALAWLAERAAQDGGNTRRSANDKG